MGSLRSILSCHNSLLSCFPSLHVSLKIVSLSTSLSIKNERLLPSFVKVSFIYSVRNQHHCAPHASTETCLTIFCVILRYTVFTDSVTCEQQEIVISLWLIIGIAMQISIKTSESCHHVRSRSCRFAVVVELADIEGFATLLLYCFQIVIFTTKEFSFYQYRNAVANTAASFITCAFKRLLLHP